MHIISRTADHEGISQITPRLIIHRTLRKVIRRDIGLFIRISKPCTGQFLVSTTQINRQICAFPRQIFFFFITLKPRVE